MDFLNQLEWRHANKSYDASKTVDQEKINQILQAIKLAPSSYGIQPYHVYVVTDPETKQKLRAAGYDQAQYTDASHILVFCTRTDVMDRVDSYFDLASEGDSEKRAAMKGYEDMMTGFVGNMPLETQKTWADRQTYIALGFALAAAAELQVDTCPMEGFNPTEFDAVLNLPDTQKSVVVMSVGVSDGTPARPKVRFSEEDLFTHI